jgi:hypothetical protein
MGKYEKKVSYLKTHSEFFKMIKYVISNFEGNLKAHLISMGISGRYRNTERSKIG